MAREWAEKKANKIRLEVIASPWTEQIPMDAWPSITFRITRELMNERRRILRRLRKLEKQCRVDYLYPEASHYMRALKDFKDIVEGKP